MADIDLDKLVTAYNNISDRIIEITTNPKPDYDIDGQKVSWGAYLKQLSEAQVKLKEQIDANAGPWEIEQEIVSEDWPW